MNKTASSLLVFITGLIAGSLAGIMFAPDTGINTRDRVTFRLEKYKKKLEELLSDLVRSKEHLPESVAKSDGEKVINEAREKAKQLLDDVDNLLDQIKK
jgi:gas vesicle protein